MPTLTGIHSLIVEDDKLNAFVAQKTLARWGVTSTLAVNGLEAIEKSKECRFSFILMDIQMPEMDGLTATEHIRSDSKNPNCSTLIWALTAYATDETRIQCHKAGMNYFLTKPLDADLLLRLIHRNFIEVPQ